MSIKIITPSIGDIPEFKKNIINDKDWENGLIIRSPNWLGDAIMSFPALLQLRKIIPKGKSFSIITPPALKKIYEQIGFIDNVICLEKAHKNWTKNDKLAVKEIGAGIGLMFNNSPRDVIYCRLAGIKNIYGTHERMRWLLMKASFKFPKRISKDFNKLHHTAKYLSMTYALGAPEWNGEYPNIEISEKEISEDILNVSMFSNILSISPGAAYGDAKMWSSDSFNKVAQAWIEKGGAVIILGTDKEKDTAKAVLKNLNSSKCLDMTGKTSLIELIYLLKKSKLCIANDSGIMHLAAALDTAGIAIYGSTDPYATSPVRKNWKLLINKQECAPCFKRECPLGTSKCMHAIPAEAVIKELPEL